MSRHIESRTEWRQLALERMEEAKALLAAGKWSGAYYLAGYAVELALKACIIQHLMTADAFPKPGFLKECYIHDLETLMKSAGIKVALDTLLASDGDFRANWAVVKDWSEQKRYHLLDEAEARDLLNAIEDPRHGILPWIKTFL